VGWDYVWVSVCLSLFLLKLQPLISRMNNEYAAFVEGSWTASFCPHGRPLHWDQAPVVREPATNCPELWHGLYYILKIILALLHGTILNIYSCQFKSNFRSCVCSVFSLYGHLVICRAYLIHSTTRYVFMPVICLYLCCLVYYYDVNPSISLSDDYLWV
jgi:hypothetical protein